jgi:RHS repeat-associated protein
MATPQQFITRPIEELFGRNPGYGFAGFGVSTAIGNYTETAVDLGFSGGTLGLLDMTRTFNSLSTAAGTLGNGWAHSYAASLQIGPPQSSPNDTPGSVTFQDTDGRVLTFTPNGTGGFNRAQDLDADLVRNPDSTFTLTYNSGAVWDFDANGRAVSRSQEGQSVTYDYDGSGQLQQAGHSSGLHVSLAYDGNGRLTQAESSDGRAVSYAYAADGSLTQVTAPDGGVTRYTTVDGQFQVTDADGNVVVSNRPASGAVTHQDFPTGGSADFGTDSSTGITTVTTSPTGAVMTFQADASGRLTKVTDPAGNAATFSYDANGYLAQSNSPGGTVLAQTHDGRGNLLSSTFGDASTTYIYDGADRPTSVTDPNGGKVGYTYSGTSSVPSQVTDQVGSTTHFESANGLITKITDGDGNTTTYDYDTAGNLISQTDASGNVTQFRYDTAGHRIAQITPSGATTQYTYDAAGRITSTTDPAGATTSYQYSSAGRLVATTDPTGAVVRHDYNSAGQLAAVTDSLDRATRYGYDTDGNLITTTTASGAVTRTEYDHSGRVTSVTDPTGAVTRHEYDADGNLTAVTDPLGQVTHRTYDARGNLATVTDPTGGVTRYQYDGTDRKTATIDPDDGTWRIGYDQAGRSITTTDPLGGTTRHEWTPGGNLAARTDALGRETRYAYTPTNQPATATDPQGGVTSYRYDADGKRISTTSPAGLTTRYRYDAAARLTAKINPQGWITRNEYNQRGQLIATISPSGAITRYRYDPAGQRTEVIDANGSTSRFIYDEAGNLITATDAKGGVTRYGYDNAGHQTAYTDPLSRTTTRGYDAAGNLITITEPTGQAQHLAYDGARRLIRRTADDGSEVSFTYDAAGRRISMTDATGTTHYSYDATGRLLTVTDPDGAVTTAGYDAAGQRTALQYPDGLDVTFSYDGNGNLIGLNDSRAGQAVFALDPDGRLVTEQLPGRFARRYHYDHGLLTRFLVIRDDHPVARTVFTHDPDGRIASQRDDETLTRFRYDPAGQLTDVIHEDIRSREPEHRPGRTRPAGQRGPEREHEFPELHLTYDVLGNRTSLRRGETETNYRYDAASQLLASETRGRHTERHYDSSGRLTEEHDGDEVRRVITYNGFGLPVSSATTWRGRHERNQAVFNGDFLLASLVRTAGDDRTEQERSASVRYCWSTDQIPQILSQRAEPRLDDAEDDRPGRLDADFAYGYGRTFATSEHDAASFHSDSFGSAVSTPDTDAWVQAERYDPFGAPEGFGESEDPGHDHGEPPSPQLPRFGYRGELALDAIVYLRARLYDTRLGRFTTPDPLAYQPSPAAITSPYSYANNDPLNRTDPLGLFSFGSLISSVTHAVSHAFKHVVHAVTGTVTRAAHIVAGAAAHAYHSVAAGLANLDAIAHKDAGYLFHKIHDAAASVIDQARSAVSRSVGIVESAATASVNWIKKHNQIIGKIGSVLSNVSGYLALAGAVIAPIPGLDFLTPVLEGAALISGIGGLAAQGLAKAAGDRNITYGDLFNAALAAIPGGGDAEDADEALNTASHLAEDAEEDSASSGDLHLALGHTAIRDTFEVGGKKFEAIDTAWLDNFAREQGAITYQDKLFSDIRAAYKTPEEFAPKLIDRVVQMKGRISFSLKGVDVESVLAGEGGGWTAAELRYIAGNPAARDITTFFHGSLPS